MNTLESALAMLDDSAKYLRNGYFVASATAHNIEQSVVALRAEIDSLQSDARRYRWLRDAPCGSGSGQVEILLWNDEAGVIANDAERDLDAAIDRAGATP